jgi:hypothetical protein
MYGVGARVHVGIDAQADGRPGSGLDCDRGQHLELRLALDVEAKTPTASARCISSRRLPMPENTIVRGSAPAARTRSSSPTETMSKPQPARAKVCSTARLEFAFTA